MSVNGGAAALGGVFSDALVQGPCSVAYVELPGGDAGELVSTVSLTKHSVVSLVRQVGQVHCLISGWQDGVGASLNADVDVLPLKCSVNLMFSRFPKKR